MLIIRRLVVPFMLLSVPVQAQRLSAPDGDTRVLDTFVRLARLIGQERSRFVRTWPVDTEPGEELSTLRLTAADRITVHFGSDPGTTDTVLRVTGVRLWRDLPDTLAVRPAVAEADRVLRSTLGPPSRCSDPLGPPSHLFATQHVYRYWPRGLGQHETRLGWEILSSGTAQIELAAGRFLQHADLRLRCDATMP